MELRKQYYGYVYGVSQKKTDVESSLSCHPKYNRCVPYIQHEGPIALGTEMLRCGSA